MSRIRAWREMSAWGAFAASCRPEVSSSNVLEQQSVKKMRRDSCARLVADQECGSWPVNIRGAEFDESFQHRFNYLVDDPAFLEDESVVSSSYQFSLSDVGELFDQQAPAPKQMDESWDAINSLNNLGDMDDIFGNNSFVQPNSLEVHSVSSSDSGTARRVASSCCPSSPDEKHISVPVLAPQSCVNKPVYWLGQQPHHEQASNPTCGEYPPPLIIPGPGLYSDTASLESSAQEQLQGGMSFRTFPGPGPQHEFDQTPASVSVSVSGEEPRLTLQAATESAQRCGTNKLASTSSGNEGTLEAAVLYQLGSTMAKLDVCTRLSIRNALYRLAKGASNRIGDGEESCTSSHHRQPKPPTSCPPMACLETCTNRIDRTVAGLLFYRQDSQQQQQQQAPPAPGCVSPHSAISSNSSWPDSSEHERVPVVMMCGNQALPALPPVFSNHSSGAYSELLSGKRGRRK